MRRLMFWARRGTFVIVIAALALMGVVYIGGSVFGNNSIAESAGVWLFWSVRVAFVAGLVFAILSASGRAAARRGAREGGNQINALYLGQRPPTETRKSAEEYSVFPPQNSTGESPSQQRGEGL